jgi:hypothetical protein
MIEDRKRVGVALFLIVGVALIAVSPSFAATTTSDDGTVYTVIEVPYSICVVQVGLVQQDGSTMWIGTGVTGAPISDCPNTTEYFTDVGGGTVAFHQFILNGTSSRIVTVTITTTITTV